MPVAASLDCGNSSLVGGTLRSIPQLGDVGRVFSWNSSGDIPACLGMARKVPSGMSPGWLGMSPGWLGMVVNRFAAAWNQIL